MVIMLFYSVVSVDFSKFYMKYTYIFFSFTQIKTMKESIWFLGIFPSKSVYFENISPTPKKSLY